ncbi:hypothetical protein Tsubulata_014395 [Turnera subulata]|uniref:RING-type domain-containing protein n=1 Tax=Turnera subulata TaxID=218843 RepID=A0A9Q0GDH7_9ROSI|nr:hypothetical protein Tsubulata_014395 [Turnera subulata]
MAKLLIKLIMLMKYLNLIATHLMWAFNFLLYSPFFPDYSIYYYKKIEEEEEELSIGRVTEATDRECAVCLSKLEEGEEIRELRCLVQKVSQTNLST